MRTTNRWLLGSMALTMALLAALVMSGSRTVAGLQQDGTPAASPMARSGGGTGAAYMTISNDGDQMDMLLSGETEVAGTVEIHETVAEGEVMQMRPLSGGLEIPAGEEVALEPGGYHVMLIGLTEDLTNGMTFDLTLEFAEAGEVTLPVNVRPRAATDDDEVTEPVTVGDLTVADVWSRPAPAIGAGVAMGTPDATPAAAAAASVLVVEHPDLGSYLTDDQGMTLYIFTNDAENESKCYDQCAENWPPFTVAGEITVPDGVEGNSPRSPATTASSRSRMTVSRFTPTSRTASLATPRARVLVMSGSSRPPRARRHNDSFPVMTGEHERGPDPRRDQGWLVATTGRCRARGDHFENAHGERQWTQRKTRRSTEQTTMHRGSAGRCRVGND